MKLQISNNENTKQLKISGRNTYIDGVLYLGFSGCFVEFETDSSKVKLVVLTDKQLMEEGLLGRVGIFVDEELVEDKMLDTYSTILEVSLLQGTHKVKIEKLSEAAFGLVGIESISIDDDAQCNATKCRDRRIEIIGDSITCGYGVEAENELQVFRTSEETPEKSYSIRTAKLVNAEYHLVSWSGIGIITNWVPEDVNEPLEEILMPHLYQYQDLRLCERLGLEPTIWDYKKYVPDLIIINIGTNDDSYTRCISDRVEYFGGKYGLFLNQVHKANPSSSILCILGTMGQNLCEEEAKQVEAFKKNNPGVHIDFLTMPEQDKEIDGMGADFHPSDKTHVKAAAYLSEYVKSFMNWK